MNPAKICMVTGAYPPSTGGLAKAGKRLAGFLSAADCHVHVVTTDRSGPAHSGHGVRIEQDGPVTVHRVPYEFAPPEEAFLLRKYLRDLDRAEHFDLLHGFFVTYAYVCAEAAGARPPGERPAVIASIRGGDAATLTANPVLRSQIASGLKRAAWVTSVNQACLDHFEQWVELRGKSSVIPNSIPAAEGSWALTAANRGVVGTVGEFRAVKDIPLLIRAYRQLPAHLRRELMLAGWFVDLPEQEWSNQLIEEFGLRDQVRLTGAFPHGAASGWLQQMHVYIQSSAREGMPNALLEAAALGVPLVATDVDGIRDLVTHGEDGLLARYGYPGELASAIERVLRDDALAAQLSVGAKRLAARFNPDRERRDWLELYRRLLGMPAEASEPQPADGSISA